MILTTKRIAEAEYEGTSYPGKDGYPKWRRYVLWDDEVKGLGVRIQPTGRKHFVLSYRSRGRKRQMTLGEFGILTLRQARAWAREELLKVEKGEDPLKVREVERRETLTVRELAARYLEEYAIPKKKPSSVVEDRRLLARFILPAIGSRLADEVDRADVTRLHHKMRCTPTQANRVIALVSRLMTLAEKWEVRSANSNPCQFVDRFKERKRERFLTGAEIRRLGEVLADIEADGSECWQAVAGVRLLLLTGCRRDEILTLRWRYVDFERGCLHLPDSKTGAKLVPLGMPVLDLLAELPRVGDGEYVLPGRFGRGHFVGLRYPWTRIRERAGLDDVRLHDLRHSFASVGAGGGLGLPVLGKLLGHRQASTTARYSHLADDPLRRAADQIAGEIADRLIQPDASKF